MIFIRNGKMKDSALSLPWCGAGRTSHSGSDSVLPFISYPAITSGGCNPFRIVPTLRLRTQECRKLQFPCSLNVNLITHRRNGVSPPPCAPKRSLGASQNPVLRFRWHPYHPEGWSLSLDRQAVYATHHHSSSLGSHVGCAVHGCTVGGSPAPFSTAGPDAAGRDLLADNSRSVSTTPHRSCMAQRRHGLGIHRDQSANRSSCVWSGLCLCFGDIHPTCTRKGLTPRFSELLPP